MMFLCHWVIFRFHPLIFRGVTHPILGFTKNQWLEDEFPFGVPAYFRSDVGFREGTWRPMVVSKYCRLSLGYNLTYGI